MAETSSQKSASSTDSTNKENAPPKIEAEPGTLPPQLQELLTSIISTLTTLFSKFPPHTVQRLAELISNPKHHYKSLPAYLHAVDRVVHVTSGANSFPLPPAIPDPSSASVLSNGGSIDPLSISWGNTTSLQNNGLGSDESLGGALLTPILWLNKNANGNTHSPLEGEVKSERTEMVEGPNGLGGIETVSVSVNGVSSAREGSASVSPPADTVAGLRAEGGVTQGELLRQEQRAGVVPAAQLAGNRGNTDGLGEDDEMPHARGPEEIGMEDMGPQSTGSSERGGPKMSMQGIDVEAAVGRKPEAKEEAQPEEQEGDAPGTPKREAENELESEAKRSKAETKDKDADLVDADGKMGDEKKVGEEGENKGPNAVDASTI
jgi:hypothetical protein